jgi:hypothetical protein
MHNYAGLDTYGLTRTGRWKDPDSADRYNHTMASPEAKRAAPTAGPNDRPVAAQKPEQSCHALRRFGRRALTI